MPTTKEPWLKYYKPSHRSMWKGRVDGLRAVRFHEVVRVVDLQTNLEPNARGHTFAFIGFAVDEGVKRNQGRIGASQGPNALRQALSTIPLNVDSPWDILDVGNIVCPDRNLEAAQDALALVIARVHELGAIPIVLGGGHELTWGHFQGIANHMPRRRIGIVNFDAHFDLRPPLEGDRGTSGSSFYQIAKHSQGHGLNFDYACIGIQELANTRVLFDVANDLRVTTVMADALHLDPRGRTIGLLDDIVRRNDIVHVSLDMDVFASAFAPGVSAPQPLGLFPWHLLPLLTHLAASNKVTGFEVAELSPHFDRDGMTAQLAATMIAQFMLTRMGTFVRSPI